jgi:hypothetical protein
MNGFDPPHQVVFQANFMSFISGLIDKVSGLLRIRGLHL